MNARLTQAAGLLLLCACTRYVPQPLAPDVSAAAWAGRTLDDSALRAVLAPHGGTRNPWDAERLAITAWYYRPELEVARGAWRTARAAEITAGARPQPGVMLVGERSDAGPFEAPWGATLLFTIPIELGGKRGARLAAARARTLAAELEVRRMAWDLASDVRTATLASMQSDSNRAAWATQSQLSLHVLGQAESLYESGAIGRASVEQATVNARLAEREWRMADATGVSARSALAQLVGVPRQVIDSLALTASQERGCDWLAELGLDGLRAIALRRRYELGAALANYAVREGELRVAVANQYPDLELGPGFAWDQGLKRWILGLGLPEILLNRNAGPIAEAVARRDQEASVVESVQQRILSEVDVAGADCRSTIATRAAARALVDAVSVRARSARAAFERGEVTQAEGAALALTVADAQAGLQRAELEQVVVGSRLARVTGLWSRHVADTLPDALSWPAATSIVAGRPE